MRFTNFLENSSFLPIFLETLSLDRSFSNGFYGHLPLPSYVCSSTLLFRNHCNSLFRRELHLIYRYLQFTSPISEDDVNFVRPWTVYHPASPLPLPRIVHSYLQPSPAQSADFDHNRALPGLSAEYERAL